MRKVRHFRHLETPYVTASFAEQFGLISTMPKHPIAKRIQSNAVDVTNLLETANYWSKYEEEEELGCPFIICEDGKYLVWGYMRSDA